MVLGNLEIIFINFSSIKIENLEFINYKLNVALTLA